MYKLIGAPVSLYTGKVRCYLQFKGMVSSTGECNILHLSQNWAFTHGNDEGARVLSFTKARALA